MHFPTNYDHWHRSFRVFRASISQRLQSSNRTWCTHFCFLFAFVASTFICLYQGLQLVLLSMCPNCGYFNFFLTILFPECKMHSSYIFFIWADIIINEKNTPAEKRFKSTSITDVKAWKLTNCLGKFKMKYCEALPSSCWNEPRTIKKWEWCTIANIFSLLIPTA